MIKKLTLYIMLPWMLLIYIISIMCCGLLGFISSAIDYHNEIKPELTKLKGMLKW